MDSWISLALFFFLGGGGWGVHMFSLLVSPVSDEDFHITTCVVPHNVCGMSVGRAPLDFCNMVCCAWPALLG